MGDKHAERRAYIGRGAGDDFFGYVTDIATEQEVYEEGEWSDVETALAWARERADEVALTYGGSSDAVFSAGVAYYRGAGDVPLARWPPDDAVREAIDHAVERERDHPPAPRPGQLGVERPMILGECAAEASDDDDGPA